MPVTRIAILGLLIALAVARELPAAPPQVVDKPPTREESEYFEKRIRPILVKYCYECHAGDPAKAKSNFVLDTRDGLRKGGASGAVLVPGHPEDSPLIEAIRYEGLEMPPREKLPDELIDELTQWVERGAPDPRIGKAAGSGNKIDLNAARHYWAFQRPHQQAPPSVADAGWPRTDVDRFLQAAREAQHLTPVADADRVTLARRITFDLTGLPPTPAEVDAFVADPAPDAVANLVDRLLASPRFGEKWGRHWLDVVRYGESTGKERNIPFRYAWRYRNYVIDAFNNDLPFDRFITEQLAGDLLLSRDAAEHDRRVIATGFLAIGTKGTNTKEAEAFQYEVIDDQIDVTTRAFLGLTVSCARCHDHKFDPIPMTDYYALAGIFRSTDTFSGVKAGTKSASDKRLVKLSLPADSEVFAAGSRKVEQALLGYAERQQELEQISTELKSLRQSLKQARQQARKKAKGKNKGQAAVTTVADQPKERELRAEIKKLEDRQEEIESAPSPAGPFAMGVGDGQHRNSPLLNRGEWKDKGEEVPRGVLTVIRTPAGRVDPRHSGRQELAHWIAAPDNPLTARVFVNRVWQHLFGTGLVPSTDNFGLLGDEPSHPELLDTLAWRFMHDQHWSVKQLIRSLVLSRSYQLSSVHHAENAAHDPANKYLWRMERRRLDAEEIRDALLAAAGTLDVERPAGSPVLNLPNGQLKGGKGLGDLRQPAVFRSVYLPQVRGHAPEMLHVFDAADPSLIIGRRDVTTVPTQALFLLNNSFVMKQAEHLAQRVLEPKDLEAAARIDLAFRLALARPATPAEQAEILNFLEQYQQALAAAGAKGNQRLAAWAAVCQTLFAAGEFRYVY